MSAKRGSGCLLHPFVPIFPGFRNGFEAGKDTPNTAPKAQSKMRQNFMQDVADLLCKSTMSGSANIHMSRRHNQLLMLGTKIYIKVIVFTVLFKSTLNNANKCSGIGFTDSDLQTAGN